MRLRTGQPLTKKASEVPSDTAGATSADKLHNRKHLEDEGYLVYWLEALDAYMY